MIHILKKGKDKSKAESYQPISLTSCVEKLMERLISTRLMWHLEDKKHITSEQAAFRQDWSTEDQIAYISQAIEDAFQAKKHTLALWIYMENVFDKVWKEHLKLKLRQRGISKSPGKTTLEHVCVSPWARRPQGGVLSPTLLSSSMASCIECPRTYKEPSMQTTLCCGAVKSTSPLQTIGCKSTPSDRVVGPVMACQSQ